MQEMNSISDEIRNEEYLERMCELVCKAEEILRLSRERAGGSEADCVGQICQRKLDRVFEKYMRLTNAREAWAFPDKA